MDAKVWAQEFMDVVVEQGVAIDEDLMLGWFANAIMCGWDHRGRHDATTGKRADA
jgi:hypothetical protein